MEVIEVIEIFETPICRVVRDRSNPFEVFSDGEFKYRFRFVNYIFFIKLYSCLPVFFCYQFCLIRLV